MAPRSLSAVGVVEHEVGHRRPVEGAVGGDDPGPEALHHRGEHLGAGLLQLPGDRVGVDDHRALGGQQRRHRRLARADATREADEEHRADPTAGPRRWVGCSAWRTPTGCTRTTPRAGSTAARALKGRARKKALARRATRGPPTPPARATPGCCSSPRSHRRGGTRCTRGWSGRSRSASRTRASSTPTRSGSGTRSGAGRSSCSGSASPTWSTGESLVAHDPRPRGRRARAARRRSATCAEPRIGRVPRRAGLAVGGARRRHHAVLRARPAPAGPGVRGLVGHDRRRAPSSASRRSTRPCTGSTAPRTSPRGCGRPRARGASD